MTCPTPCPKCGTMHRPLFPAMPCAWCDPTQDALVVLLIVLAVAALVWWLS